VDALAAVGYAGALSIEHEDRSEDPLVGVTESAAFAREILRAG
jgi:sugar phosphate isomerase/epimerase